jgi:hypothetical protein
MQFSLAYFYFNSLGSRYTPQYPALKHLTLCSSLNIRDQFSRPYKTRGKIIVLYIKDILHKAKLETPKETENSHRSSVEQYFR